MVEQSRLLIDPRHIEVANGYIYAKGRDVAEGKIFVYDFTLNNWSLEQAHAIAEAHNYGREDREGLTAVGVGIHEVETRIHNRASYDHYRLGLWVETIRKGLENWPVPEKLLRSNENV